METGEKRLRGFATWPDEKRREAARKGGQAAHAMGRAHEFNSKTARIAGAKGGRTVSRDREHMSRIGRLGGNARSMAADARYAAIQRGEADLPAGILRALREFIEGRIGIEQTDYVCRRLGQLRRMGLVEFDPASKWQFTSAGRAYRNGRPQS